MKNKIKSALLVCLAFYLFTIFIPAQTNQSQNFLIRNFKVPLKSTLNLHLIKEIIIEISQLDTHLFIYLFKDIIIDPYENIFILTNNSILKYSPTGKFLHCFMIRLGEGPGELKQYPLHFTSDSQGNIFIYDGYKFVKFNTQFKFQKNIQVAYFGRSYFDNSGYSYGLIRSISNRNKSYLILSKSDDTGKRIRAIAKFEDKSTQFSKNIRFGKIHFYSPYSYFCLVSDGIIYGFNLEYKLFKYNFDGTLDTIFNVEAPPSPISSIEKNYIINENNGIKKTENSSNIEYYFPSHRPFFKKILTDEKNRIYVIRRKSVLDKNKGSIIDIFSNNGSYLYRINLPFEPLIIKNGYMYDIETYPDTDGDDLYRVRKFKILNNNRLKY